MVKAVGIAEARRLAPIVSQQAYYSLAGRDVEREIVIDFEEQLGAPALLIGFSLPGCNLHAPDEWLPVENFEKGIRALALLYGKLGS